MQLLTAEVLEGFLPAPLLGVQVEWREDQRGVHVRGV